MKIIDPGVVYVLEDFTGPGMQQVRFTSKDKAGVFTNGTTVEELLKVLIDKLYEFQKRSHSADNQDAIDHLREAEKSLRKRLRAKQEKHANATDTGK